MPYQVLARKYRPQRFADVIGQPHVTRTLKNALEQGRVAHGYIFSGHRGIGKTTIARILAMALNCRSADHPVTEPCGECDSCTEIRAGSAVDVIEIDAATNRGIDEIRELRDAARYRPARDRYKIYILDEAHQITDAAFNALLKTLEEPPPHIIFMMATTQPEDIPQTIRSRCQNFSFHAVRFDEIVEQLRALAAREGISADEDALALLAEAGDGSMRDALSIMDQAIACCGATLARDTVRDLVGAVPGETLEEIMSAVARNASEDVLRQLDRLLTEGQSPVHLAQQLVRFLRNATVAKVAGVASPLLQISPDERARAERIAAAFSEEDLARLMQIMLRTHSDVGYRQEQRFHLELGLLKMVHAQRLLPLEQLLSGAEPRAAAPERRPLAAQPSTAAPPRSPAQAPASSPFQSDRARKGASDAPAKPAGMKGDPFRRDLAATTPAVQAGSAPAVAIATDEPAPPEAAPSSYDANALRERVLADLEAAGQHMLALMLADGEWTLAGNDARVKIAKPQSLLDMSFGAEPRRVAASAAAAALGRPIKLQLVSGTPANGAGQNGSARPASLAGGRNRALEDPVVKRVQEKFGAEVRTIVDHQKKK
jgi:DNA polymerase-3 subunit gamma/tau